MYDVIVIGARCAGAPTAMLLARQGYRVLLLERASFPSDHLSTLLIHARGLALLKRWRVLDAVLASNCPRLSTLTLTQGAWRFTANIFPFDGIDYLCAPRRIILDRLLVEAAVASGVEFCPDVAVQEIVQKDGRVVGVRARTTVGTTLDARASIVVGADGVNSLLARSVQAKVYKAYPTLTCNYYTFFRDLADPALALHLCRKAGVGYIPTHDGLVLVTITWPIGEFAAIRKNIAAHFYAVIESSPYLAELIPQRKQVSRFYGTGYFPNFFRTPYGNGWALVGDAGYHKDQCLAAGISDAFRDAQLLADAVDAGLSGACSLMQALASYEQRRNEIAFPLYQFCIRFASFKGFPKDAASLEKLSQDQEVLDRYVATMQGSLPASELLAPEPEC